MRPSLFLLLPLAVLIGCAQDPAPSQPTPSVAPEPASPPDSLHPGWSALFEQTGGTGTAVVLDVQTGQRYVHDPARAARRFAPASTFKIYNSLVALETGVVPDVDSVFAWDGVDRGIEVWNQDHSLRTGIAASAVWLYQRIAREVGLDGYRAAFAREPYGDGVLGDSVAWFWLGEPLGISADEQIRFVDRLRRGDLAFRPEVQAAVREILLLEETEGVRLYGKTGWTWNGEERRDEIGWFVGWIERGDDAWIYALNIEPAAEDFDMLTARVAIRDALLADLGLRPRPPGE